jgi:hypothetical protein
LALPDCEYFILRPEGGVGVHADVAGPRRRRGHRRSDFLLFQKSCCILGELSDKREINDGARAERSRNGFRPQGDACNPLKTLKTKKNIFAKAWKSLEIAFPAI